MSKKTHQQISSAIDAILTQGAEMLYQSYLLQKLPADCQDGVVNNIQATFDSLVIEKPKKSQIRREIMPRPATVDLNCCHKVPIRSKSEIKLPKRPIFNTQITNSVQTKQIGKQALRSGKPSISFKTTCIKGQVDKRQEQIRTIKIQSDKLKLKHNQNNPTQQKLSKTNFLQLKIKQLLMEGVPYAYDDDGNYIMPDIKTYKKQIQKQSKKKIQKPFTLRYKALQLLSEGSEMQNNSSIKGRKRGYSSISPEKKKKISEDEFTNRHERQFSAIPFMNVADGVKFVQRQRNIMAEKLRSPTLTREQFIKQSKKSLFKSFMPTSDASTFRVSDRPGTNAQSRKSLGIISTASFNVRPKTSKDRVNINNKQLARQMVKEDSFMLRKVI